MNVIRNYCTIATALNLSLNTLILIISHQLSQAEEAASKMSPPGNYSFFIKLFTHFTNNITNKNITRNTIWKTEQHKHWTLSVITKRNKVIETRKILKNDSNLSILDIHQVDWKCCVVINVYIWDWENKQAKKKYSCILYLTEPLNLSDSIMKLIEHFNIPQFCWNLTLLLP